MNRMIHEFRNYSNGKIEENLVGVIETVRWISTKWDGPGAKGEYFVSDGNGVVRMMHCTGHQTGMDLFKAYIDHQFELVRFSNGVPLTSDDLIQLCMTSCIWYDIDTYMNYDISEDYLTIMLDADKPKFFMETKPSGPIDSELDTYDKVYVDLKRNVIPDEERKVSQ